MATKRESPYADANLYARTALVTKTYDGFGRGDFLSDIIAESDYYWMNQVTDATIGQDVPAGLMVKEAKGALICRCWPDINQTIELSDFSLNPTSSANVWEELDVGSYPFNNLKTIFHLQSQPGSQLATATLLGDLPRDPMFCVALNRNEPAREGTGGATWSGEVGTAIRFGVTGDSGWALVIPYNGPAYVAYWRATNPCDATAKWEKLPGSEMTINLPSMEGYAKGERAYISIGVIGGMLAVSSDFFRSDVKAFEPPEGFSAGVEFPTQVQTLGGTQQIIGGVPQCFVKQGKLSVAHRGGQFGFTLMPMTVSNVELRSRAFSTGYATRSSTGTVEVIIRSWPIRDKSGAIVAYPTCEDVVPVPLSTYKRQWQLTVPSYAVAMAPVEDPTNTITWRSSPAAFWVQTNQAAVVSANSPAADASVDETDAIECQVNHTVGDEIKRGNLLLENQTLEDVSVRDLGSRRHWQIEMGWSQDVDGSPATDDAVVFKGLSMEPDYSRVGGKGRVSMALHDFSLAFLEGRVERMAPLDACPVYNVIDAICDRVGLGMASGFENTGMRFPVGSYDEFVYQLEKSRNWWTVLQEVAQYDHYGIVWVNDSAELVKGCRYCRAARSTAGAPLAASAHSSWSNSLFNPCTGLWTDPTAAASGCEAVDLARHGNGAGGVDREYYCDASLATDAETGYGLTPELHVIRREIEGMKFATLVKVSGKDAHGKEITATVEDVGARATGSSVNWTGGWAVHSDELAVDYILTQGRANMLALRRLEDVRHRPLYCKLRTPLDPHVTKGWVVSVKGGAAEGVTEDMRWRVISVSHHLRKSAASYTTILGRYAYTVA